MGKDDFLIIGFTGAFGSGCTTGAKFFSEKINEKLSNFVSTKDEINSNIVNYYRRVPQQKNKSRNTASRMKNELLKFLRERQFIKSLEKINDLHFCRISLTTILNFFIIRDSFETSGAPSVRDEDLIKIRSYYERIALENDLTFDAIKEIQEALDNRDIGKIDLVNAVFKKINELRNFFSESLDKDNYKFIRAMQKIGNNLRRSGNSFLDQYGEEKYNNLDILAHQACLYLKLIRADLKNKNKEDHRTYFVVECFRNPAEINYFRKRFYEFYLFSVFRDQSKRVAAGKSLYNLTESECDAIDKADQGKDYIDYVYAQNIKTCVNLADIAVTNNKTPEDYEKQLLKYFALIKSPGCVTPTHEERNMHLAYSVSLNSTCISRQVGAVISKNGYVIGVGWNDVESFNVGCLYRYKRDVSTIEAEFFPLGYKDDHESIKKIIIGDGLKLEENFCYKDEYGNFKKNKSMQGEDIAESCQNIINKIKTKSLQECRSLHAEENAILQVARTHAGNLEDAVIYTTTFPCELCTKKILQVGISKIIYCEPYPKSISNSVFFPEHLRKIEIVPFDGVKSPSFFRLFKSFLSIKDAQSIF